MCAERGGAIGFKVRQGEGEPVRGREGVTDMARSSQIRPDRGNAGAGPDTWTREMVADRGRSGPI